MPRTKKPKANIKDSGDLGGMIEQMLPADLEVRFSASIHGNAICEIQEVMDSGVRSFLNLDACALPIGALRSALRSYLRDESV